MVMFWVSLCAISILLYVLTRTGCTYLRRRLAVRTSDRRSSRWRDAERCRADLGRH